jgi:sugar diacid utilization regulator
MSLRDEVLGVVFLDDVDRPHAFSAEDAEIASTFGSLAAVVVMHAQLEAELRGQVDAGTRHIKALRRATAVDDRLSDLVLEGRSLQDLLDTLAELLGKPCAVFSDDGQRLACAASPGSEDGMVPRLLEPGYASRPEVRDALASHGDSRAFVVGPFPQAGILHRHVVAAITVGGRTWGRLVVMEHQTRFVGGDMLTLRRAATLVALQINAERQAIEADGGAGASLVSELMSTSADLAGVRRRADRLGICLEQPRVVMLVGSRDPRTSSGLDYRPLATMLHRLAPELSVHLSTVSDGVAILARVPEGVDDRAFVSEAKAIVCTLCERVDPDGSLIAAVSGVRRDAEGYRDAYEEAGQTVDCIRRFSPAGGPSIFTVDDLGAGRLFLATSDGDLVTGFAESTIGTLVGDPAMADLLTTLCSFFDNMASIRRCATCLGVHENTIRYRLARIENLTGLAVTHDPDAQLRVRLSLLVLLLQGRLPAGRNAGGAAAAPVLEAQTATG